MLENSASNVISAQPKKRCHRTKEEWRSLVDAYQSGTMKKTAFCKKQGIAVGNFTSWCKKLKTSSLPESTPGTSTPFIALHQKKERMKASWDMELVLPGGFILKIKENNSHD